MVSVSPLLGDRLIFFRSVRESAFVGAGLTATFTFNAAKAAPFCKPYPTLIFISADGFGFALAGRLPFSLRAQRERKQREKAPRITVVG